MTSERIQQLQRQREAKKAKVEKLYNMYYGTLGAKETLKLNERYKKRIASIDKWFWDKVKKEG